MKGHIIATTISFILFSLIAFFGVSEYVDYRIKQSLAEELVIEPKHITFLNGKGDVCEDDQFLFDEELGICINNIAFGQFSDTDVEEHN